MHVVHNPAITAYKYLNYFELAYPYLPIVHKNELKHSLLSKKKGGLYLKTEVLKSKLFSSSNGFNPKSSLK